MLTGTTARVGDKDGQIRLSRERAEAVRDLLRPNGALDPAIRSGSLYERQVLVGRSLAPPAEQSARSPQPVMTQPVDTLLIPQGKPFGRQPPR